MCQRWRDKGKEDAGIMRELYKDCQKDYEENLELFLETREKEYYDNIFIDFKTYCFNKIRQMKSFLPTPTVDEWATEVTLNAMQAIKNKGINVKENWPKNMGGYLSWFCLGVNNAKKFSPENIEVDIASVNEEKIEDEGETFMQIEGIGNVDNEVSQFVITEAIKMTVFNDGYEMVNVDRAIKLYTKYNGKIGRFSQRNMDIIKALKKNIESILKGNVKVAEEK